MCRLTKYKPENEISFSTGSYIWEERGKLSCWIPELRSLVCLVKDQGNKEQCRWALIDKIVKGEYQSE